MEVSDLALLDINVRTLRVPKVGRTAEDPRRVIPVYVEDPDGNEIEWVTRVLNLLHSNGLAVHTCCTYAKSFYRAAVPIWALGVDPLHLTALQWAVVRGWLRECMRRSVPVPNDFAKPLSASTVSVTETALNRIYGQAKRLRIVTTNPVADLHSLDDDHPAKRFGERRFDTPFKRTWGHTRTRVKVPAKEIVTVSPEMQERLRNARQPRDRALFTFCLDTGPRISEALSLTLEHYRPDENLSMLVSKGHDGARRMVPVADATAAALADYLDWLTAHGLQLLPDEPLFRHVKAPYEPLQYGGAWAALRRLIGPETNLHPHALRHTAATDVLRLLDDPDGRGLETLRLMLGHANVATTTRYLHLEPREVINAVLEARKRPRRANPGLDRHYKPEAMNLLADILKEDTDEH